MEFPSVGQRSQNGVEDLIESAGLRLPERRPGFARDRGRLFGDRGRLLKENCQEAPAVPAARSRDSRFLPCHSVTNLKTKESPNGNTQEIRHRATTRNHARPIGNPACNVDVRSHRHREPLGQSRSGHPENHGASRPSLTGSMPDRRRSRPNRPSSTRWNLFGESPSSRPS